MISRWREPPRASMVTTTGKFSTSNSQMASGGAEFIEEMDVAHALDAFRQHLGCAADGVQIGATVIRAGFEGSIAHAAFSNYAAKAEIPDDLALIRFFTNGGRRAGGDTFPFAALVFDHHRAAVIEDAALKIDARRQLTAFMQIFMDRIAAGEQRSGDGHFIAHLEGSDVSFGYRSL